MFSYNFEHWWSIESWFGIGLPFTNIHENRLQGEYSQNGEQLNWLILKNLNFLETYTKQIILINDLYNDILISIVEQNIIQLSIKNNVYNCLQQHELYDFYFFFKHTVPSIHNAGNHRNNWYHKLVGVVAVNQQQKF